MSFGALVGVRVTSRGGVRDEDKNKEQIIAEFREARRQLAESRSGVPGQRVSVNAPRRDQRRRAVTQDQRLVCRWHADGPGRSIVKRSQPPATSGSSSSRVGVFRAASPCSRSLEEILAETGDGAFVVDPEGFIVLWNRAAERLLGWSAQEVVGLACWEALAGADGNGARLCDRGCQALRAGTAQRDVHRFEMQARTKGGEVVWLDITALETPMTSGGRPLVVHLFRDVTATIRSLELIPRQSAMLPGRADLLSAREFQVLGMMAVGANTRTIAVRLRVSPATIRNHAQSIFSKLGVHSRLEAVAWMHRHRPEPASGMAAAAGDACRPDSGGRDESARADEPACSDGRNRGGSFPEEEMHNLLDGTVSRRACHGPAHPEQKC